MFVTHDQEEALSLADRVAVMRDGRILQIDTPAALYAQPVHPFVASFVGDADIIRGISSADPNGRGSVETVIGRLRVDGDVASGPCDVVLRPERMTLRLDAGGQGVVDDVTYFGHDQLITVVLDDGAVSSAPVRVRHTNSVGATECPCR